jgi:ATP adenylyltransferase
MVAPYSHKPKLRNLKPEELEEMIKLLKYSQSLLDKVLQPTGYNIGINEGRVSGAGIVNHVHMHVVPRWQGDTNFMPVVSQTKIIPQALSELYQKLKKAM